MKRIVYIVVALALFVGTANAQNDPNAKKVLDQVSAKLKNFKGLNGLDPQTINRRIKIESSTRRSTHMIGEATISLSQKTKV